MSLTDAAHAPAGIAALVALSWALSEDRGRVRWRVVISGLALQAGPRPFPRPIRRPPSCSHSERCRWCWW